MTAARLHLRVRGRVQGVGFRWFVREEARRSGLAGWVRNCDDGSVEVAVGGEANAVARLGEALRRGPERARVDAVEELPDDGARPLPHPFAVHRG